MSSEPLLNESDLRASLLNGDDPQAAETTAAGSLIGSVRDMISGKASNGTEARERAQTNDMLAEVAADTFAMMPGVSWLKAGGIRAAVLINPHANVQDNATKFGLNFAEGVALHGVSKLAGNALHNPMAERSLMAESLGMAKFGAGMGGVKALFNEHTWHDKDGKFNFGDGLSNFAKATTVGGIIGVPAGLAGARVAKFALPTLAEAGLNPRALSIGIGAISGYPAGAVFGGVDNAMHGGKIQDILKSAHQGGMVGMFAGGLTGGFMPREIPGLQQRTTDGGAPELPKRLQLLEELPGKRASRETSERVVRDGGGPPRMFDYIDNLELPQRRDLRENLERLGGYTKGRMLIDEARPNADEIAKSSATLEDFAQKGLSSTWHPSRIYKMGNVEVHVPESYAAQLDEVYRLMMVKEEGYHPDATPLQKADAIKARTLLEGNPLANRVHPADLVALDQLADRSIISKVELLDSNYWADAWHRKTYEPDFYAAGTASDLGTIAFYKAENTLDFNRVMHHEWAHVLAAKARPENEAYMLAAELEAFDHSDRSQKGFSISEYGRRNGDENLAEHSAALTKASQTDFFTVASEAPIRTAILGKAITKALMFAPADMRSPYGEQIGNRMRFINETVLPRAQSLLEGYLQTGKPHEQIQAVKLLRELGDKRHFDMIKGVATHSKNPQVADAAFNAAREMAFYGREVWTDYNISQPATHNQWKYTDFLVEMAKPGSKVRDQALMYLEPLNDRRSQGYYDLLTWETRQPHERLPKLVDAMKNIPEMEGKEQALEAARRVVGPDKLRQYQLAINIYQQVPGLKEQALHQMIQIDPIKTEPILTEIARRPTHRLNGLAKEGLREVDMRRTLETYTNRLKSPDAETRQDAMAGLAETGDKRVIDTLLKRFANAGSDDRGFIQELLAKHFNHQIVKAEVHRLTAEDPRWGPLLRPILERRVTFMN